MQLAGLIGAACVVAVALISDPAIGATRVAPRPRDATTERVVARAADRAAATASRLSPGKFPHVTDTSGRWATTKASDWTSGFFAGELWQLAALTGDPAWSARARAWTAPLESQKKDTGSHDVGFKVFTSFGGAYAAAPNDKDRKVLLTAARSLASRYRPEVGCIRSWGSAKSKPSKDFTVIIDNLMNLELLWWAARHGGSAAWADMAAGHARKTMVNHVRADGSTFHVVEYDARTGAVRSRHTAQGYADGSTWSRGQAWAVHGFTTAYRETGDPDLLATARRVSNWFLDHLPPDSVPFWDFDRALPGEPRDSSAAAIAAAGLAELARLDPDSTQAQRWRAGAERLVSALSSDPYLSTGAATEALLLHGTKNRRKNQQDTGLIYGDYYLLQALTRLRASM